MAGEAASGADARPLSGCTVLVTRARHQAAGLAGPLEELGAEVLVAPVIETVEPVDWGPADEAIGRLGTYDWVVLTSANAVDRFFARMRESGLPIEMLTAKVAVVGPATAERLAGLGIEPDLVPDDYRAEGLLDAFRALGAGGGWRVLVPRAASAREVLPETLRDMGATVDVVPVYRTVPATPDPALVERLRSGEVAVITFTSPSTVRHFHAWLESAGLDPAEIMRGVTAASIGPVTSKALAARGWPDIAEAMDSTAAGLVEAVLSHERCS